MYKKHCAANRCVQMTILDAMGNEVGVKRSCLESFLTSYVMFVAPNSSSSRALTDALIQKKQSQSSQHLKRQPDLTPNSNKYPMGGDSSRNNYMNGGDGGYAVDRPGEYYGQNGGQQLNGDPNFASDQPIRGQGSNNDDGGSVSLNDKIQELSTQALREICGASDKRLPCRGNYLDSEVCRIECCSTPLCNSAASPSLFRHWFLIPPGGSGFHPLNFLPLPCSLSYLLLTLIFLMIKSTLIQSAHNQLWDIQPT